MRPRSEELTLWSQPGNLRPAASFDRAGEVNAVRGFGYPLPDHLGGASPLPRSKMAAGPFYSLQARERGSVPAEAIALAM